MVSKRRKVADTISTMKNGLYDATGFPSAI